MSIFKSHSDDAATHVRNVRDKAALVTTLQDRHASLEAALTEFRANIRTAALAVETGSDSKVYDKAAAELERLKRDQARTADALDAARQELAAAEREMRKATKENREKDATKLCAQRSKATEEAVAALMQLYAARQKVHDINRKIADVFGPTLTTNHGGTLLSASEVQRALEVEIARISSPLALDDQACPALPGAHSYIFGNPAAADPLASVMEAANAELVRRVTAASEDVVVAQPTAPAPLNDPDDAILQPPADNAGETIEAAQVMAGIPARGARPRSGVPTNQEEDLI